jgi:hypothetical protein
MSISYAITVCNELTELKNLLPQLYENKQPVDQLVVLFDSANGTKEVQEYLEQYSKTVGSDFVWASGRFEKDFADWKNQLNLHCTGDYIFQIDADEYLPTTLIEILPSLLKANPEVDLYYVPRINTVEGLTEEHVRRWGWKYENSRVNWPDYQTRIYRNSESIKWRNKVHEVIDGHKHYTVLPPLDELALIHSKTIERQEKQNAYYATL